MRASYVIAILMIVFIGLITSCAPNAESGPTLGSLDVVTIPWDGGHYSLDPLPLTHTSSTSQNITSRGLYNQGENVTINIAPAAGWMLEIVYHAEEWAETSMQALAHVEGRKTVVLGFKKRPGVVEDKLAILDSPELKLETNASSQLTSVTFIGGGFKPRSKVTITYGNELAHTEVGSATANNAGNIEGFFQVPNTAKIPSDNIVTAKDDHDHQATAQHSVPPPSIAVQAQPGSSGNKFILTGEHFPASTPLTSASVASTSVLPSLIPSSDDNGNLSFKFVVPVQLDGPNTLIIESGSANATTHFLVVGSKLQLASSSNQRNTAVNWTARGFTPGSTVMIKYLIDQNPIEVASQPVNEQGEVQGVFNVPSTANIPSSNPVSAISTDGMTASATHDVPPAVIEASPTQASFKSTIVVAGVNFPASSAVTSAVIGSTSVLPDAPPLTDEQGDLQFEFPYPDELEGEKILVVTVDPVSAGTLFKVLSPKLILDSTSNKRGSIVYWHATGFTPGSSISVLYGPNNEVVASGTVDSMAESNGHFKVPQSGSIPSTNSVTAIGKDGLLTATSHVIPAPSIQISPSRISFGSRVILTGKNFPASQPLSNILIGKERVPRSHRYATDSDGNIRLEILIPYMDPGRTNLKVQMGSLNAETTLILTEPASWPIPFQDLRFTGQAWKPESGSNDCSGNICWRSGSISSGGFSTIWLYLYKPQDDRYKPYMKRESISFEVKTSTEGCCDKLTFSDSARPGDKLLGTWSGNTSWTRVKYAISAKRPSFLEWTYRKNATGASGADRVWLRNVALE